MTEPASPRVFLSHSSADKSRFVFPFAERLRAGGVDVWLDHWELLPGDSLVQRIFEEGIDGADAVIVVISRNSLRSRWVNEELSAAVVKRINEGSRLIPIVLDHIPVDELPVALRHLVIEFVPDVDLLDHVLDRVQRSIFNIAIKPAVGTPPPPHTSAPAKHIAGLDRIDSLILKLIGEEAVRDNGDHFRTQEFVDDAIATLGLTADQVVESLEVLNTDRLIRILRTMGSGIPSMSRFTLTGHGAQRYFDVYVGDYGAIQYRVVARLAEMDSDTSVTEADLSKLADAPRFIVDHILSLLESNGYVTLSARTLGGQLHGRHVFNRSPKLRRLLD